MPQTMTKEKSFSFRHKLQALIGFTTTLTTKKWTLLTRQHDQIFIPVAFEGAWVLAAFTQPNHIVPLAQGLRLLAAYMHLQVSWVYVQWH